MTPTRRHHQLDRSTFRERFDAFPAQAVLTAVWVALVAPTLLWWRESVAWIVLMTIYTTVVTHWTGHLAWRSKRADQRTAEAFKLRRQLMSMAAERDRLRQRVSELEVARRG